MSPQVASAAGILNGQDDDANGSASTTLGGAIAGALGAAALGQLDEHGGDAVHGLEWERLSFPAENSGSNMSVEGLLLNRAADSVKSDVLPDGQSVVAVFHAGDFSGNWLSTIEVTVEAQLTAHDLDLTVIAKNTGQVPAPFGAGWHPFFAIPSGDRADALLSFPSQTSHGGQQAVGVAHGTDGERGRLGRGPVAVGRDQAGDDPIGATYTSLLSGVGERTGRGTDDPSYNYRLSVIPLTPDITSMRVIAPADKPWVSIGPNTNLDDPFGPEWDSPENAGMITLAPGSDAALEGQA